LGYQIDLLIRPEQIEGESSHCNTYDY